MKKILYGFVILGLLALGTGGAGFAQDKIVIPGTGDSQDLLRKLAKAFEEAHPGKTVEVPDPIGSQGAIRAVANGKFVLGRIARTIAENEKQYQLNYKQFAFSPIAFVVNPSVKKIDAITSEQVVGIYSGQVKLWSDLGGEAGKKIYVVEREKGDASRTVIENTVPGFREIPALVGKIAYTTPETVAMLLKYKDTLGFVNLASVMGTNLVVLKLDGVYPTPENVQNKTYKLAAPFGLIWKGELPDLAKAFLDFLFTPQAQGIITEYGAVSTSLKE